ncbi:hypothetical protein SERLA73DRAFT_139447 [Serpula lacrymans var. lacrymans S7.3]|uniref:Uncharacterized protein n=1 Tax=Serpula lacrymans var. lacrymans (strain S7.3) TaxID=936435 RepID=F8Q271_SERL3|nr:hypothetical protein SERLA73DRAFT_139447 [Serpula lacrymans var. lacrymans S7.3]
MAVGSRGSILITSAEFLVRCSSWRRCPTYDGIRNISDYSKPRVHGWGQRYTPRTAVKSAPLSSALGECKCPIQQKASSCAN